MNNSILNLILIFFILTICACNKDEISGPNDPNPIESSYDCTFEQNDADMDGWIDETESAIMIQCMEDALSSLSDIENNLIGEWELIGHGEGWIPTRSQPCGYITITTDALIFEFTNEYIDSIYNASWDIELIEWASGSYFSLRTDPPHIEGLGINQFCEKFMFGNATPFDGNMYLYEKVK